MKEVWKIVNHPWNMYASTLHIPDVLAKILSNRVSLEDAEAYMHCDSPVTDPFCMKDMQEAVNMILNHVRSRHRIDVCGDYDVDGLTSTVILGKTLRRLGADFALHIPDRMKDGYGLRPYLVDEIADQGGKLILTCDNGIAEREAAQRAAARGLDLVITDHHDIPLLDGEEWFPAASAIVNPKRSEDRSNCQGLCGAGVAFQLSRALLQTAGVSADPEFWNEIIGFAALGTVCDVMELTGNNRKIVYQGLRSWNRKAPVLIDTLSKYASIDKYDVYSLGFMIGPMLNSGGRLENQLRTLELLMNDDVDGAMKHGAHLYELNNERKRLMEQGMKLAMYQVQEFEQDHVKVIYLPETHESIAGLIAGKIKEATGHPVFVITGTEDVCKGSGRSIPAYSMYEEMTKAGALLEKFGGHPMAAGLSIRRENIPAFRKALNAACLLTPDDFCPVVRIDMAMSMKYANDQLCQLLEQLQPFGTGNPQPLFACRKMVLRRAYYVGKNRKVMKVELSEADDLSSQVFECTLFRMEYFKNLVTEAWGEEFWDHLQAGYSGTDQHLVDVCYQASWNHFRGRKTVQIVLTNIRCSF